MTGTQEGAAQKSETNPEGAGTSQEGTKGVTLSLFGVTVKSRLALPVQLVQTSDYLFRLPSDFRLTPLGTLTRTVTLTLTLTLTLTVTLTRFPPWFFSLPGVFSLVYLR